MDSAQTKRMRRQRPVVSTSHAISSISVLLTILLLVITQNCCQAQFNEPPGQRREQTFRVREFELSNINQHYPGDLRYYCTFRGKWSQERHPRDFPKAASWSAPVIMSHSKDWRMWTGTETVTAGVEYMAEQGFPTILYNEFQNAGFETLHMIVGDRMYNTTESQHLPPLNVTYNHPWLSAITKISPSPDWFVGFSDFRTISYDTETFYNRFVIQSYVWDAGTDDGQNYLSFDRDLDPQETCMRFCVPPDVGQGGVGTYDSNIAHVPGKNQIHHPTANTHKCPDKEKGRVQVPRAGQFLDYSASYIPFPAEYECVLRVGDGEVYAGHAFNETQIRPPKYVARPDDDFLDGISPYDQPAYDNYVKSIETGEPIEEEEPWNKHLLWLVLLLLCCCCPCVIGGLYMWLVARRKKREELSNEETDLHLFVDEGMHPEGEGEEDQLNASFVNDNIDDYDDTDDYDSSNLASGKASHVSSRKSMRSNGGSFYGDNNNNDYGLDSSYNTGVSTGDDYDSWLASQNVSQNVEYEGEDGSNSSDGDEYDSERLKPPSLNSMT